jgi:hypothetical protein
VHKAAHRDEGRAKTDQSSAARVCILTKRIRALRAPRLARIRGPMSFESDAARACAGAPRPRLAMSGFDRFSAAICRAVFSL